MAASGPARPVDAVVTLALALALDRLGEPPNAIHPVAGIGALIGWLDRRAPANGSAAQLLYGVGLVAGVATLAALTGALAERWSSRWPLLRLAICAVLLKTTFAERALLDAAAAVGRPLAVGDLPAARTALRALVSRDRERLDANQIAAAAIESVAENLSDSLTAPLLAYALGGLPAAAVYRAVNTADAMIGYHGRYEYLGKAAARLDDLLNLLPARLTAALIALAAGERRAVAWSVARRDHRLTASPNAGWPMAAMAGALGVALEKVGHYRLNAGAPPPTADDLTRAIGLAQRPAWLAMGLALAVTGLRVGLSARLTQRRAA
ncbi:MAG: cobalamin biosynthesis protein CobD [Chloroflexi bacterium]|nr:cobalamin biosynthesis protein CobD [Chloroflexota bacterium]